MLGDTEFNIEENAPYRSPDWSKLYIGGRKHISFETEDLAAFLKQAKLYGAKIVKEVEEKPWGWKEAIIVDLDGNEFVIEQEV